MRRELMRRRGGGGMGDVHLGGETGDSDLAFACDSHSFALEVVEFGDL